ncbi:hypothetical protein GVN16_10630 [Emticicia sp. CRIBPO]|uniref:hypothetical protein n=1 Tax=Emticicia sp. CRIBPO TaxID=2683258 RepID=UPI001412F2E8|nr:hypothetical protein [Emticicia sp. CRIBPO]NBA86219.1 hypothetical protein [Emticicia sp. CRIBPO]
MKKSIKYLFLLAVVALAASCKVDDPFVDRTVSPVLVLVKGANGVLSSGLTTEPSVTSPISASTNVGLVIFELDKTGLLDYKVGIDSIPVSGLQITYKLRATGATVGQSSTNANGVAPLTVAWSALGVATPTTSTSVLMMASGTHKGVSFTKYFRIAGSN